jgi:hypothetical protein
MSTLRLAQPDPRPEGLLAHARRIAKIALRATDTVNGDFLIAKAEEQYTIAIQAFDRKMRKAEANQARAELKHFRTESQFVLHDAPVLAEDSAFRSALDTLAASDEIGPYYNGTNDIDEIVSLARRRMGKRDSLSAAEDATRAATCLLWRAHREEETIAVYNEFTDALIRDVVANLNGGHLYLVEKKAEIARRRLLLTGRADKASELEELLAVASKPRPMGSQVS